MDKKEILVVEDQPEIMKLECILLQSRGYRVKGVSDGKSALDYIAEHSPDLVLLDIMIPGIDGFEVCRQIKSNEATKGIPVIMLTAKMTRADMAKGEQVGADAYMTKPFRSANVVDTIDSFLSPSRSSSRSMQGSREG